MTRLRLRSTTEVLTVVRTQLNGDATLPLVNTPRLQTPSLKGSNRVPKTSTVSWSLNRGGFVWSDVKTFGNWWTYQAKADPITIKVMKYKAAVLSLTL